jgi:GNAT superfamily N-acetyltransferase
MEIATDYDWCEEIQQAKNLADFFCANVTSTYITQDELDRGRAISDKQWSPRLREIMRQEFTAHIVARNVAVARADDRIIACGVFVSHDGRIYLNDLIVEQAHRHRGIGQRFLMWLKAEMQRRGAVSLWIACGKRNSTAQSFFRTVGFVPSADQPDPLSVQMQVLL